MSHRVKAARHTRDDRSDLVVNRRGIKATRSRRREKADRAGCDHVSRKLRAHEKVIARGGVVQSVDREHIRPIHERADERCEIHRFRKQRLRRQPIAARDSVEIEHAASHIPAGDLGAVQVGHKAIVVIDRHRQRRDRRRTGHIERIAQKRGRFFRHRVRHRREQIRTDEGQITAARRARRDRPNHQASRRRIPDEFEIRAPRGERPRPCKNFALRAAPALENDHANVVIAGGRKGELPDEIVRPGQHVVALGFPGIEEIAILVQINLDAVPVIAIHAKRPRPRGRDGDDAGALDNEVVNIPHIQRRRIDIAGVVTLTAAVPEIQSRRGGLRRLPRRAGHHRLGLREIADRGAAFDILKQPPIRQRLKARPIRPARPRSIDKSARGPSRAERVVGRHEVFQRTVRRHISGRRHRLTDAIRLVGILRRIWIKNGGRAAILPQQRQITAIRAQLEIGVKIRCRIDAIFRGSEDDEEAIRRKIHGGKNPFRRIASVIGKTPPGEIHRGGSVVKKLDPVRSSPVFIGQAGIIIREKLGDNHVRASRGEHRGGEEDEQGAYRWEHNACGAGMSQSPANHRFLQ